MKKMMSLCLVLVLALCLTTTAFAANGIAQNGQDQVDVKATYTAGADQGKIYSVDISWSGMDFTYTDADTKWNPETHTYENTSEPFWSEGQISVTNHSNAPITAEAVYAAEQGFEGISMNFSSTALEVASADTGVDGTAGEAQVGTITVHPAGALNEGVSATKIGTITISIK